MRRRTLLLFALPALFALAAAGAWCRPARNDPPEAASSPDGPGPGREESLVRSIRAMLAIHEESGGKHLEPGVEAHMRKRLAELEAGD